MTPCEILDWVVISSEKNCRLQLDVSMSMLWSSPADMRSSSPDVSRSTSFRVINNLMRDLYIPVNSLFISLFYLFIYLFILDNRYLGTCTVAMHCWPSYFGQILWINFEDFLKNVKREKTYSWFLWSAMTERFSASDLCSDGRVVRMWIRIPTATVVLMSLSKTLYRNCFSPPMSKWVPVRAELVVVFD